LSQEVVFSNDCPGLDSGGVLFERQMFH